MNRADVLRRAGEEVGGPNRLAKKLKIGARTIFRYLSGERRIPDDLLSNLTAVLVIEADKVRDKEAIERKAKTLEHLATEALFIRLTDKGSAA